jgi:hypothetical protein
MSQERENLVIWVLLRHVHDNAKMISITQIDCKSKEKNTRYTLKNFQPHSRLLMKEVISKTRL